MVTVVVVAVWLLVGCAVGFAMVRRGHSPYLWLVLVVFGPLSVLFAIGARDDAARSGPTVTASGEVADGPLHLLVGVDGSQASRDAATVASQLFERSLGKITLVAVRDYESTETHPRGDAVQEADEWLRVSASDLTERGGPAPERLVLFGDPATELTNWAHEHHADVIVVAARSHWTARHLLAGSVTRSVLQKSPCPVVVVPSGPPERDDPVIHLDQQSKERNMT